MTSEPVSPARASTQSVAGQVHGNAINGDVSTAISHVDVVNVGEPLHNQPAVDGPVPEDTIGQAKRVFCQPPGLPPAASMLNANQLVVLCAADTGRSLADIPLLLDTGCSQPWHLDPYRNPLGPPTRCPVLFPRGRLGACTLGEFGMPHRDAVGGRHR